MANPHGTDWCAPGAGATADELYRAAKSYVPAPGEKYDGVLHDRAIRNVGHGMRWGDRTNLRLTGRNLVTLDLERIAQCEVP